MPFPVSERVMYGKSPLLEVICQLRFPRILSINNQDPYEFQEKIRNQFPLFSENLEHSQQFSIDVGQNQVAAPRIMQSESQKNYSFISIDEKWKINLTSTFISISTTAYTNWEDFLEKFSEPLKALVDLYKPAIYERVGLRYIDVFNRNVLGLSGTEWADLIEPHALGFLCDAKIGSHILNNNVAVELVLDDGVSNARIMTSLGTVPHYGDEVCFVIDSDLFTTSRSSLDIQDKLNYLHTRASRLLRWSIKDKLHESMEPTAYENK